MIKEILIALKAKRVVITGGPGSGKTTLINHLENMGYACMHEVSRQVINEARKQGIDQLFLTDPLLFSQKLLESRMHQFHNPIDTTEAFVFYDRGTPDVTAYMDFIGASYASDFEQVCFEYTYDVIFLLPPWQVIYTQDNERYESFAEAQKIYHSLIAGYQKYGYNITEVPTGTVEERSNFVLAYLKN